MNYGGGLGLENRFMYLIHACCIMLPFKRILVTCAEL